MILCFLSGKNPAIPRIIPLYFRMRQADNQQEENDSFMSSGDDGRKNKNTGGIIDTTGYRLHQRTTITETGA